MEEKRNSKKKIWLKKIIQQMILAKKKAMKRKIGTNGTILWRPRNIMHEKRLNELLRAGKDKVKRRVIKKARSNVEKRDGIRLKSVR